MRWLTLLITVPLTVFSGLFVYSNLNDVTVSLWPLDGDMTLPVYQVALGMLAGGFFLGALFVSILSQKTRFSYWQEKRRVKYLEKELDVLHKKSLEGANQALAVAGK